MELAAGGTLWEKLGVAKSGVRVEALAVVRKEISRGFQKNQQNPIPAF